VNGGRGVAGFTQPVKAVINAFPDIQWKVFDLLEDGDKVAVRWKWEGTHLGTFNVYEATGKKVIHEGMAIFELRDGKIISQKLLTDRLGFLQQIDVLPKDLIIVQQTNK
jgi:predicted ester cyclase